MMQPERLMDCGDRDGPDCNADSERGIPVVILRNLAGKSATSAGATQLEAVEPCNLSQSTLLISKQLCT